MTDDPTTLQFLVLIMVSHDMPADADRASLSAAERQMRALQRLDDGHAAFLSALSDVDEAEAFLGSRWSVWEVMQHLLTENFVEALEQIASGEREMLPAFDGRANRIAADIARLEANYQRFRKLIDSLSHSQLHLPATPANPENDFPGLSLLELIERVAGHEGNHARQVSETRKFVGAFQSAARAVTVAGLGTGARAAVPTQTRELLANADYVVGTDQALGVARPWIRGVELLMRQDNRDELVNRLARDARAGLWSMVVTLGDPAESAPGLLLRLREGVHTVSIASAPGFYRSVLDEIGLSPLGAVCTSAEDMLSRGTLDAIMGRAVVILGSDAGHTWGEAAQALAASGVSPNTRLELVTGLSDRPLADSLGLADLEYGEAGENLASIDSALVVHAVAVAG